MRIAITAKGKGLEGEVDPRFGRAENFIIFDTETDDLAVVDNKFNVNAVQGAGVQAAGKVVGERAAVLITGHCGPKAFRVLSEAGIKVYTGGTGTVGEALDMYRNGSLDEASEPDVGGHW